MLTRSRRLRSEDGNVLIIAVMMVMLMLVLGTTALSTVDTQTDVAMKERQSESTFNLAEGILHAQTYVLARLGTGSATNPFPEFCTNASAEAFCPDQADVETTFDPEVQPDYDENTIWTTRVRDNPAEDFYSETAVDAAARYDANDDQELWVRAEGRVRGRVRTIVALVRVEFRSISFPGYALAGGWFETSNNGRKTIVDSTDSLGIAVRCVPTSGGEEPPWADCLEYNAKKGQLEPEGHFETGYPEDATGVRDHELQDLEAFARSNGTHYESCPSDPNGLVVVIESGDCSYTNSAPPLPGQSKCCNSAADPGVLIMKCGSVGFGGNIEYYGIVYVPNQCSPPRTDVVVATEGTALITGGVIVDGPGGIRAGSSGMNIQFDPWAFADVEVAGTAGVVQNTWREIPDDN